MKIRESDERIDEGVDRRIRRRFEGCVTLPLFPEVRVLAGFFEPPEVGRQLRIVEALRGEDQDARERQC
jgi:hypothetical protein